MVLSRRLHGCVTRKHVELFLLLFLNFRPILEVMKRHEGELVSLSLQNGTKITKLRKYVWFCRRQTLPNNVLTYSQINQNNHHTKYSRCNLISKCWNGDKQISCFKLETNGLLYSFDLLY